MKVFVPLSDELLYEHPEQLPLQLVPYQVGLPLSIRRQSPSGYADPVQKYTDVKKGSDLFWQRHED